MGKKVLATLLAMAMLLSLGVCGASAETDSDLTVLKIALPTWVGYGPLYVAKEKGFFAEQGLEVELSIVESLDSRKVALASGKIDGLATAADVFVSLDAAGVDMGVLWVLDRSNGSDGIVATADITSPADLKGKTVATELGTTEHLFLLRVMAMYGLSKDDITLMNMTVGDAGTAFISGQVDAAVTYDPYLAEGVAAGGNAFTTAEYDIDLVDAIGFSDSVIESEPEAMQAFVNAMAETADYINANMDECVPIMAEGLNLDEAYITDTLAKLECYDLSGNFDQMGTEEAPGKIYETCTDESDFYLEEGITEAAADVDNLIAPQFVRSLAE